MLGDSLLISSFQEIGFPLSLLFGSMRVSGCQEGKQRTVDVNLSIGSTSYLP